MANTNNPHGLQSLGTNINGGPLVTQEFQKAVGDVQAIFKNDIVARVAGGAISAAGITPGTTLFTGVALSYGAASTLTTHIVYVDPLQIYEAQAAGTLAAADMGKNANVTFTVPGVVATKLSGTQIDDSTKATTATLDLHLMQAYFALDNAYGANARIEVIFNKARYTGATAGV